MEYSLILYTLASSGFYQRNGLSLCELARPKLIGIGAVLNGQFFRFQRLPLGKDL
jgi:hypothetical protein